MQPVPISPEELIEHARRAQANAYAPYSGFPVGAAVETDRGTIQTGANVENASYGISICAERVAICSAVSAGARRISAVAVVAGEAGGAPCGACRQFMAEFADARTLVSFHQGSGIVTVPLADLLPHPFAFSRPETD
jgi:cytidine deaminase